MTRPGSRRNRVLAWAAVGTGLAASAVLVSQGGGTEAPATRTVLVAARDVPRGASLAPEDLAQVTVPAATPLAGLAADAVEVVGRPTLATLRPGEPVTAAVVARNEAVAPLRRGQRAVPVPASAAGGSAALLAPGARVDVVAARGEGALGRTAVVVWNAEVIAVPPPTPEGYAPDQNAAVLLRATPRDALRITGALNFARDVRLVVRPAAPPPAAAQTPGATP